MKIEREEIRTGALVVLTLLAFVGVLVYLGSPGLFVRQKTYWVYFDDVSGMKPGAQVLIAGRKVGQVRRLFSPVPADHRPEPQMEALVEMRVDAAAMIYREVKVTLAQPKLLGEPVVDFANGVETSGLAPDGHTFVGERVRGLADAVPAVLEKIDPVLTKATATMETLQKTAENLSGLTAPSSDLSSAIAEFRAVGKNLNEMSSQGGSLRTSMQNVEKLTGSDGQLAQIMTNLETLTGPGGSLTRTMQNAERFTAKLVNNRDIEVTLRNFRRASENLDHTIGDVGKRFTAMGENLEQGTDTLKRQPWRLIWPTTKKYPEDEKPTVKTSRPRESEPATRSKSAKR